MREKHLIRLERLGLSSIEAAIYLALLESGAPMGASAIVAETSVPRSSVYPALKGMTDTGLIEAEAGYGGRFAAIPPERALASLILRGQEELSEREKVAKELADELKRPDRSSGPIDDSEAIQVLRDSRVVTQRFEQLLAQTETEIHTFVKAPILNPNRGNPAQQDAQGRGVRIKALYERAVLKDPLVRPYLEHWVANGEQARIYGGELPHKLVIFDRQNILMPLITAAGQGRTLFIRHPQLARSLGMLFDFLWGQGTPLKDGSRQQRNHQSGPAVSGKNHQIIAGGLRRRRTAD